MTHSQQPLTKVTVVKRKDIPALTHIEKDGKTHSLGELRDFHKHPLLENFIPENARLSVAWAYLKDGEELKAHYHPEPSFILITQGQGELTGELNVPLEAGDIALIPSDCEHGFIGRGEGLHGLTVQFDEVGGLYENPDQPLVTFAEDRCTLNDLLAHNQKRLKQFKQHRALNMLIDGTLSDSNKRKAYLETLDVWVKKNQALLIARQATCDDPKYADTFAQHMSEEVGHDDLYANRQHYQPGDDIVIDAIASWFVHQMFILDNCEKAALIHLVIEHGSDYYHKLARPLLANDVNDQYFKEHEADSAHSAMGKDLLKNLSNQKYARLCTIIDKGWDMLDAMLSRLAECVDATTAETADKKALQEV